MKLPVWTRLFFVLIVTICALLATVPVSAQTPQISALSPDSGVVGTEVTISGTGFGATAGTVSFNWTNAAVESWSDTQIVATVSSGTTTGAVRVINGGVTSNAVTFTMPNPQIASISPRSGPVGTAITVNGSGFGSTAGTASVNWKNAQIQSWTDTQVVLTVASGTTSGGVRVVNGGVTSNAVTFTMPNPQIAGISPTSGPVGTSITVTGSGFGATAGTASVNWTNAQIQSWSDTQVVLTVAPGTTSGGVRVVNGGVTSNAVTFTMPNPQIASISPSSGSVGTAITVNGSGFGATAGTGSVNWTNAPIQSWSDTQVVLMVSPGTTSGGVRVVNGGVVSNAASFLISTAPQVSSISPKSGPAATQVTITGSGFGATQGSSTVFFGGSNASVASWSDTAVVAIVPVGASSGQVVVTVAGNASNGTTFTVLTPPPQITSASPDVGGLGTMVTLSGTFFGTQQGTVTFGNITAVPSIWSDSSILVRVPDGVRPGAVNVIVNAGGIASNGVSFTVTQPLFLNPKTSSLFVGDQEELQVLDENGVVLQDPSWALDDDAVAQIAPATDASNTGVLQANTEGTVKIIATVGDRTATGTVSVYASGASLPNGTVRWAAPSLGGILSSFVHSTRIDDNTPDFYAEDDGADGGNGAIRALTANGKQKWVWPADPTAQRFPTLAAADYNGGVIYFANDDVENQYQSFGYVGRLDQSGNELWRYQISNSFEDLAIAPDGTIFLMEDDFQNLQVNNITGLDPVTGNIKFSITLPGSSSSVTQDVQHIPDPHDPTQLIYVCSPGSTGTPVLEAPNHGFLSVSSDGTVYLPIVTNALVFDGNPCDPNDTFADGTPVALNTTQLSWSTTSTIQVMAIKSDGSYTMLTAGSSSRSGTNWNLAWSGYNGFWRAVPDAQGSFYLPVGSTVYHGSTQWQIPMPASNAQMSYDPLLVGEDGSVYITAVSGNQGPDTVLALDPSGVPKWSAPLFNPTLNTIGADGSAYVEYWQSDFTTHLAKLDPNGAFSAPFSSEAPVAEPQAQEAAYWTLGSWNALLQNRTMFASLASDLLQTADSQRPSKGGSAHKTNGPSLPVIDHFFPAPLSDYGVTGSYANLEQGFKDTVTGTVAKQTFWEGNAATIDDFLKQLAKPVAAVSFVGHSFDVSAQPGGFVSVGLRFGLSGLSALARITPDPNNPNLDYTISDGSTPTFVTHINTQAKVVFVGLTFPL